MFLCNIPAHPKLSLLKNYLDKYKFTTCYYYTSITYMFRRKRTVPDPSKPLFCQMKLGNEAVVTPLGKYQPRTLCLHFLTFFEALLMITSPLLAIRTCQPCKALDPGFHAAKVV